MAIITVADLAAYFGRASFEPDNETLLEEKIIPAMQKLLERKCVRTFEAAEDTIRKLNAVKHVGTGDYYHTYASITNAYERDRMRRTLYLDTDLCAITEITNGDGVVITSDQYTTDPVNETPYHAIVLKPSAGVYWTYEDDPEDAISIEGRWAYSVTPPEDIVLTCLRWSKYLYRQRDNDKPAADQPQMSNDGVWIMPTSIPKDILEYIQPLIRRM